MVENIVFLLGSLAIILVSCELFTNGIEWLGKKLGVGDGVVGSIFSAVGTCLPETMIPVIAILFFRNNPNSVEVGIGAIVGAPFMLSTLAFFITGISVIIFCKKRRNGFTLSLDNKTIRRDLGFFIVLYSVGIGAGWIDQVFSRYMIILFLIGAYLIYILMTIKDDKGSHEALEELYLSGLLNAKPGMVCIVVQISAALAGIIVGAHLFVQRLEEISMVLHVSSMVLALIIAPIATELPEKFNSILWISKGKDTLALGNITGAMVFQSCIPVSVGIYATRWSLDEAAVMSALMALLSALLLYFWIKIKGKISSFPLVLCGCFYVLYLGFLFYGYRSL